MIVYFDMNTDVMFSSQSNEWATPQSFFDKLNKEFGFTLDPCSTHENAKCEKHYTIEEDGLSQNWGGGRLFSAILHMGETFLNGLRNAMMKADMQLLSC